MVLCLLLIPEVGTSIEPTDVLMDDSGKHGKLGWYAGVCKEVGAKTRQIHNGEYHKMCTWPSIANLAIKVELLDAN